MKDDKVILGAGITGLSAGYKKNIPIYEATEVPGGICASYYVSRDNQKSFVRNNEENYRFEIGGGHWIFGADKEVLEYIHQFCETKWYERKSSVYFPDLDVFVPYPLQNHLVYLPENLRKKALEDILAENPKPIQTLADWLEVSFGKTLCELFFFPFHELYTAGLYKTIAPQDQYKSPVKKDVIIKGATEKTASVGYNTSYFYPVGGLNALMQGMAKNCQVYYQKKVIGIDLKSRQIRFADGSEIGYKEIISTLSVSKILEMTGLEAGQEDPYSSVLVINIGARKGSRCPGDHWIYVPGSKAGFHRVGFYSNVDTSFLPQSSRAANDRVSIYVEKGYKQGQPATQGDIERTCREVVQELTDWGMISEAEVISPTWVEVAYTWQFPSSQWAKQAGELLKGHNIIQTGRYGKWKFQGIADSIRDGWNIC